MAPPFFEDLGASSVMPWRMIKMLILLGVSIALVMALLQAFLAGRALHG